MSVFLMGVWDPASKQWCTVAKCGNGHDDKTIERLNRELKMKKISKVCGEVLVTKTDTKGVSTVEETLKELRHRSCILKTIG